MSTLPEAKGPVLLGLLQDSKETLAGGTSELVSALPEEIRASSFESKVRHASWYPYAALAGLLDTYSGLLAPGRPAAFEDVGARSAARDLNTLLKAWALISSPARIADMPAMIWNQRFRHAGKASTEKGESWFRFTISGFPGIHPLHCRMLTGYGDSWGKRWTSSFVNSHDRCVHRGDADCSFVSRW